MTDVVIWKINYLTFCQLNISVQTWTKHISYTASTYSRIRYSNKKLDSLNKNNYYRYTYIVSTRLEFFVIWNFYFLSLWHYLTLLIFSGCKKMYYCKISKKNDEKITTIHVQTTFLCFAIQIISLLLCFIHMIFIHHHLIFIFDFIEK